MTTEGKNGKRHAINIYSIVNIFILAVLSPLTCFNTAYAQQKQWVIVIDPGHGGRDPGAVGSFSRESDINLAIALKTGEYLEKNVPNVKIVYTRKDDSTVDLYERPRIANANNADLFVSIHTNKTGSRTVMGAETYIMGLTKDEANLAVAMKENEVMLLEADRTRYQGFDPKSTESYIMFSLMQNVYQKQSTNLAWKIQTQLTERVNRKDRGVKMAPFWVLYNSTMPRVLVETGFISNLSEEKFLNSAQGRDYMASAIFRACKDYIDEISSRSVVLTDVQKDTTITATPLATTGPEEPEKTVFMVQISSSKDKKETKPENFKGMKDIVEISSEGRFRYASGSFDDYQEAIKYRKEIKNIYPDAFVIAVRNNEIVPLQQAITQIKNK